MFGKLTTTMSVAIVIALGAYPLLVYFGLLYFDSLWVAVWLLALCALRLLANTVGMSAPSAGKAVSIICAGGILLAVVSVVRQSHQAILFYPVLVNLTMLTVFAYSLVCPPSIIERLARLRHGDLGRSAIAYTRNVTFVWAVFFLINGTVALYTALYASLAVWTLYNGLIAYVLIALLFAGEWILRGFVMGDRRP